MTPEAVQLQPTSVALSAFTNQIIVAQHNLTTFLGILFIVIFKTLEYLYLEMFYVVSFAALKLAFRACGPQKYICS